MKRIASYFVLAIFVFGLSSFAGAQNFSVNSQTPAASEQPLGDYARAQKKDKKAAHTFDNDNLPVEDKLNIVGKTTTETANAQAGSSDDAAQQQSGTDAKAPVTAKPAPKVEKMPEVSPGESAEDRQKVYDKWQDKLTEQQQKVDLANRELDVLQREYKLRAADFYADAGNRLRNQTDWDKKDADYKKQLEDKQQEVNNAKESLNSVQEDARKAGVPNSVTEKAVSGDANQAPQN